MPAEHRRPITRSDHDRWDGIGLGGVRTNGARVVWVLRLEDPRQVVQDRPIRFPARQ